jgi:hypothetical protein
LVEGLKRKTVKIPALQLVPPDVDRVCGVQESQADISSGEFDLRQVFSVLRRERPRGGHHS